MYSIQFNFNELLSSQGALWSSEPKHPKVSPTVMREKEVEENAVVILCHSNNATKMQ